MTFFDTLLREGREALTLWAFLTVAVAVVFSRALPNARLQRLRGTLGLLALHVVLLAVTAALASMGSEDAALDARIAARVLLVMAWVGAGGALLFGVLMSRTRFQLARILQDLIVAAVTIAVVVGVLKHLGVSLAGLFATSAVVTAVIGFSLQDTLGNTIGGLALQADGSVQVGDWIKVPVQNGDVIGRVTEIRWRYTAVETRNWETVLLPNGLLMKGPVVVMGRRGGQPQQWRRWIYFNVDFRYPPSDVIDNVVKALHGQPLERVAIHPQPDCILMDLHESYGRYAVRYYLTDLAVDDPTDSVVRTRIMFALKRAGIPLSIPAHAVFLTEESKKRKEAKSVRDLQQRLDALRRVDLFAPLDDEELANLAHALHPAPFTKGEPLTTQGKEGHWLYLVIDGEVSIRVAKGSAQTEIARLGKGSFFGEMSLMTGEPRSATVVALTDVDCYRLDKPVFQELVRRRPEIAAQIAELLAERRARRASIEEDLDLESRARKRKDDERDLLHRMKSFFGLDN
jgi:small-conductance mechanosensitive channel/CRP-like cAMP-binding protein